MNFPTYEDQQRINKLASFDKLYKLEHQDVFELSTIISDQYETDSDIVYIQHAIPKVISEYFGEQVQGNTRNLDIKVENGSEDEREFVNDLSDKNELKNQTYEWALDQSVFGYEVIIGRIDADTEEPKVEVIPQDQYYPQPDGSVILASYLKDTEGEDLLYTQHYKVTGENTVTIERKLFETDGEMKAGDEVSLSNHPATENEAPEQTLSIGRLPIYKIDNGKKGSSAFGKSDYVDIMTQLQEINERMTHIDTQLLKNLDARMMLPKDSNAIDEDGEVQPWDYLFVGEEGSDVEPKYISNDNPLIEETFKFIEEQMKTISIVSKVPFYVLRGEGLPETAEAMRLKMSISNEKINTKRAKIEAGIKYIAEVLYEMMNNGQEMSGQVKVEFDDIIPVDRKKQADIEETLVRSGLSSKVSAMMRIHDLTEEEARAELNRMRQETRTSGGASDTGQPPQI